MRMLFFREGRPVGERLYLKVTDARKIQKIESRSMNWVVKGIAEKYNYIILEQRDAYEKPTGYCRIIKRERAIIENRLWGKPNVWARCSKDWVYYERRG